MKTAGPVLLALVALAGCASSPAGAPAATAASVRRLVLVEVDGRGSEADAFVSRFLLALSERGLGEVTDARLAGAALESLRDASSSAAERFRTHYPGDAYVGVKIPPCQPIRARADSVEIECSVTVRAISPAGASLAEFEARDANFTGIGRNEETGPEVEAARGAATKAAKKLAAALGR